MNAFHTLALRALFALLLAVVPSLPVRSQTTLDWVERSNEHARVLLDVLARQAPEQAGRLGVDGLDEEILDLTAGFQQRDRQALQAAKVELQTRFASADEGPVKQDLHILLNRAERDLQSMRLEKEFLLPYIDVSRIVYQGLRYLLEDRIPAEQRRAALGRLKRYAGQATGYEPLAQLAEAHLREEWAQADRLAPYRGEIEQSLSTSDRFVKEIGSLFEKYELDGYQHDYTALRGQVAAYNKYIRSEILPLARDDHKLPAEIYTFQLQEYGVDMTVDELRRRAAVEFMELQDLMQALAVRIAQQRQLDSPDYRDVIRALKSEQIAGEAILPFYQSRMEELEAIIARESIVTLPRRPMRIRLATDAESARAPAPFMSPPRLIGNTGEYGEFVLPVRLAGGADGSLLQIDDFTYQAASWPLAAHEGRPGHELQYASILERGVSQARAIFAQNSVNVEGWALYMEEQMLPFLPLEGQFTTLWSRMVRAARAFLDPGLNLGTITRKEAQRILQHELVLSEALVRSELERYTFRAPGQATSYFNGYLRLMELRAETELKLGDRFDKKAFHDFVLSQGLLPPALLRQAVFDSFVN